MATIHLIRHGQASFGKANYDELSDLGQQQATRLGQALAQRMPAFDAVFLGSMLRHKQTASNCLAEFNSNLDQVNAVFDAGWNEYGHEDILAKYRPEFATHESMREFLKAQPNPKKTFAIEFNNAMNCWIQSTNPEQYKESWQAFTTRVHDALERVVSNAQGSKSIAVFTSGGVISLIAQSMLGVDSEQIMKMNWTLLNCGVSKVVCTDSRRFLSTLNEHSHFEGETNKHFLTYT